MFITFRNGLVHPAVSCQAQFWQDGYLLHSRNERSQPHDDCTVEQVGGEAEGGFEQPKPVDVTAQLAWKLHPLCDESMVRANGGRDIVLSRRQGNGESGQANAGTDVGEVLGSICLTASSRWIPRGNGSFVAAALTLVAVVMSPKQ